MKVSESCNFFLSNMKAGKKNLISSFFFIKYIVKDQWATEQKCAAYFIGLAVFPMLVEIKHAVRLYT